jgi:hypothetical protein
MIVEKVASPLELEFIGDHEWIVRFLFCLSSLPDDAFLKSQIRLPNPPGTKNIWTIEEPFYQVGLQELLGH